MLGFERFFVSPVCAPTRASLLTGRDSLRTGILCVTRGWENMRTEELTLAESFWQQGYSTGCFGKWHSGRHFHSTRTASGFDGNSSASAMGTGTHTSTPRLKEMDSRSRARIHH